MAATIGRSLAGRGSTRCRCPSGPPERVVRSPGRGEKLGRGFCQAKGRARSGGRRRAQGNGQRVGHNVLNLQAKLGLRAPGSHYHGLCAAQYPCRLLAPAAPPRRLLGQQPFYGGRWLRVAHRKVGGFTYSSTAPDVTRWVAAVAAAGGACMVLVGN